MPSLDLGIPGPRAYYASSFGIRMSISGQNFPLSIIDKSQSTHPKALNDLSVGSEEARLRAGLRPPPKPCTCSFPAHGFHEDTELQDATKRQQTSGPFHFTRPVGSGLQYPQTMMYGFFAKRTDPPHHPYSAD